MLVVRFMTAREEIPMWAPRPPPPPARRCSSSRDCYVRRRFALALRSALLLPVLRSCKERRRLDTAQDIRVVLTYALSVRVLCRSGDPGRGETDLDQDAVQLRAQGQPPAVTGAHCGSPGRVRRFTFRTQRGPNTAWPDKT